MTRASDTARLLGAGATILDGTTISTADNTDQLTLTSTDADANSGPNLRLYRNSASPADDDFLGTIDFEGRNDNSQDFVAARIFTFTPDVSDGSEDAQLQLSMMKGGTSHLALEIKPDEFVINQGSVDLDFRVESNGNANMLHVDGGNDIVGIGVVPTAQFSHNIIQIGNQASLGANAALSTTGQTYLTHNLYYNTDGNLRVFNTSNANEGAILQMVDGTFRFSTSDATTGTPTVNERSRIDVNGNLLVGRTDNPSGVSAGIYVTGAYAQTASSSANMFVNSEGRMMRSTSSLRYKNTINDATHGLTEVLALRPVTFKGNNDGDTIFGGLIAEEVHDAGLTEFVAYNENNEPDSLHYGSMVSLCIKAIQELSAKVTALENA